MLAEEDLRWVADVELANEKKGDRSMRKTARENGDYSKRSLVEQDGEADAPPLMKFIMDFNGVGN